MTDRPPILLHDQRLFVDEMGVSFPVTQWLDADGDEVDDPDRAIVAIAGAADTWFTLYLEHFPRSTRQ